MREDESFAFQITAPKGGSFGAWEDLCSTADQWWRLVWSEEVEVAPGCQPVFSGGETEDGRSTMRVEGRCLIAR